MKNLIFLFVLFSFSSYSQCTVSEVNELGVDYVVFDCQAHNGADVVSIVNEYEWKAPKLVVNGVEQDATIKNANGATSMYVYVDNNSSNFQYKFEVVDDANLVPDYIYRVSPVNGNHQYFFGNNKYGVLD